MIIKPRWSFLKCVLKSQCAKVKLKMTWHYFLTIYFNIHPLRI